MFVSSGVMKRVVSILILFSETLHQRPRAIKPAPRHDNSEETMTRSRRCWLAGFALLLAAVAGHAAERGGFPSKPVRIIVPYAPGGGLDFIARLLQQPLNERWGVPVIVDNRPGASGMVGTQIVQRATPDGYTVAMVSSEFITAPLVYRQQPYDTIKDFTGIVQTASQSYFLVVHPSVPAKSVKELVEVSKTRELNWTSSGLGGMGHLSGELLKKLTGMRMVYVNYKGTGPALADTLAGQVQVMFVNPLPAVP